ncbi:MAG: hypothetical protein ACRD63_12785, partial [Pyrinomonadaceae bacterium]
PRSRALCVTNVLLISVCGTEPLSAAVVEHSLNNAKRQIQDVIDEKKSCWKLKMPNQVKNWR